MKTLAMSWEMGVCLHGRYLFHQFLFILLQVELHVHLDGAIRPETILHYGR